MGKPEIKASLTSLAVDGQVSASTQTQALSALLFYAGGERLRQPANQVWLWMLASSIPEAKRVWPPTSAETP